MVINTDSAHSATVVGPWRSAINALRILIALALLILSATDLRAASVTLAWDRSPEPDVAGYLISYGTQSGTYTVRADVGNVATWTVASLNAGQRYYFVVQAYNTSGGQSAMSNEAFIDVGAVTTPSITNLSPTSAIVGAVVTISGANFGTSQGSSTVRFNGTASTPSSWNSNTIVVPVPNGATTGTVVVTVGGATSNGLVFTVQQPSDTQAPTAPGPPTATAVSNSRIDVAWTASVDNVGVTNYLVERCQGAGCSNFAQVVTSTSPSFSDVGLTDSTSYTYRVRATDAANNMSAYSSAASATTQSITSSPIAFVQANYTASFSTQATVAVPFASAQQAGDMNVVVVGWNDTTATVQRVTDTQGNVYTLAAGPTVSAGVASQVMYYAPSVSAGANTVTVTFASSAKSPSLRVAEYAGIDAANPLDVVASAQGASALGDTGSVTTTSSSSLLFGANFVQSGTTAGAGFTLRLGGSVATVRDTFTGPNGTALGKHAPETGGSWIEDSPGMVIQGNKLESPNFGDARAHNATTPLSPDYEVQVDVTLAVSGAGNRAGVRGRDVGGRLGDAYEAYFSEGTHTWALDRWKGFNPTTLGTYADPSFTAGTKTLKLRMVGTSLQVFVNGTLRISATDASITAANHAGLLGSGGIHNGLPMSNFLVQPVSSSGATSFLLEDRIVSATGTYNATAAVSPAGPWIMQMAAFRGAVAGTSDIQPPTPPASLTAAAISSSSIQLSWTASTDNVGVKNYLVERCQNAGCVGYAQIAASSTTSFNDTGLAGSTSYSYRVRATDAASNLSGYSNAVSPTTAAAAPNITSLSPASGAVGTAVTVNGANFGSALGTSTVRFNGIAAVPTSWSASTLVVPVPAGATTGVVIVTVNNVASNGATFTVSPPTDTQAPTAPGTLTATAISNSRIDLAWTASTDNIGVTNYLIERCQGAGCTGFVQIAMSTSLGISDTGLTSATGYTYRVRASDGANNLSAYSNAPSATTKALASTSISFVQANYGSASASQTTISVPFLSAQQAGDVNIVVVGWNDATRQVQAVTDALGNPYVLAVGPTVYAGVASQSTYYAPNIIGAAAGANTVTVTFTGAASAPNLRIAEYSGADPAHPVDMTAAAQGSTSLSDSGSVTTTSTSGLLVAANLVQTATAAGAGFTVRPTAGKPGIVFVRDTFSAANGTSLGAHAPDLGGAWIEDTSGMAIQGNQLESPNFGDGRAHNAATPTSADYDVQVDVTLAVAGYGNKGGVRGRDAGGRLGDAYEAYFSESAHTWILDRWKGFNSTTLGTFADPGFTAGTKTLTLRMIGSSIQVFVNGTLRISATDSGITAANHPGLRGSGGIHNGLPLSNYLVQDVSTTGIAPFLLEDRIVTVIGAYRATAVVSPAGPWIMQMVVLK